MDVNEFISLNVPVEADHVAEVAFPPMIPAKLIVVPEQMVISVPAVAVAGGVAAHTDDSGRADRRRGLLRLCAGLALERANGRVRAGGAWLLHAAQFGAGGGVRD